MVFFPSQSTLKTSFANQFFVSSTVDDVKNKASELTKEAEHELAKAAQAIKPAKKIPLFSAEYYLYCTLGGILGKYILYIDCRFVRFV